MPICPGNHASEGGGAPSSGAPADNLLFSFSASSIKSGRQNSARFQVFKRHFASNKVAEWVA